MGNFFLLLSLIFGSLIGLMEIVGQVEGDPSVPFPQGIDILCIVLAIIFIGIPIAVWISDAKEKSRQKKAKEKARQNFIKLPESIQKDLRLQEEQRNIRKIECRNKAFSEYHLKTDHIYSTNKVFKFGSRDLIANKSGVYLLQKEDDYMKSAPKHLFEDNKLPAVSIQTIPISKIQCFMKVGDVQYTSKVSGGGGGGYSLAGAIVGGIIGGSTGAIIESRRPVQQVKTTIETHDTRKTQLRYLDNNGTMQIIEQDGFDLYDYLLKAIPQKDLLSLQIQNNSSAPGNQVNSTTKADRLRELKSLLDDGILTQEEFNAEKQKILNS